MVLCFPTPLNAQGFHSSLPLCQPKSSPSPGIAILSESCPCPSWEQISMPKDAASHMAWECGGRGWKRPCEKDVANKAKVELLFYDVCNTNGTVSQTLETSYSSFLFPVPCQRPSCGIPKALPSARGIH